MSNLFYTDEDSVDFANDVRNGEVDIEKEAQFLRDNYPEDGHDLELKYDPEECTTTASYNGKELFTVDGNKVSDSEGNVINADASGYRQLYQKEVGEEGVQAHIARDYVAFRQDFVETFNEISDEIHEMGCKLEDYQDALNLQYEDVSIKNTQGCYVTVSVGDKEENFALHSKDDEDFDKLVNFVKDNAKEKDMSNSLNAEQAILLADIHGLSESERAEFLLKTLDEKVFEAENPYYQPVLDGVKEDLENGEDPKQYNISLSFKNDSCVGGLSDDGIHHHTSSSLEELLTDKGMDELESAYSVFVDEGWRLTESDKELFSKVEDFVYDHFENTDVEIVQDGGVYCIEVTYGYETQPGINHKFGNVEEQNIGLRQDFNEIINDIAKLGTIKEGHAVEVADACELTGEDRAEFLKEHGEEEKHSMKM
ncbi:hypothetical protein JK182_01260 [Acetobacter okinawensis]|uniref:hypothetical protein n=1 Tax=Acetobacter okinawensis TaxID=1076594 RepID=UPI001BA941A7|nr:hypothetical protein [Acetobacter okinawensis]MBS0987320.1 hypothetical protein [Acetobacter okinawensis]